MSDGTMTEVDGEKLQEGLEVVLGEQRQTTSSTTSTTNPFVPQLPVRRR
jgi:hypothetical protein